MVNEEGVSECVKKALNNTLSYSCSYSYGASLFYFNKGPNNENPKKKDESVAKTRGRPLPVPWVWGRAGEAKRTQRVRALAYCAFPKGVFVCVHYAIV